jgi:hypothetical protein
MTCAVHRLLSVGCWWHVLCVIGVTVECWVRCVCDVVRCCACDVVCCMLMSVMCCVIGGMVECWA